MINNLTKALSGNEDYDSSKDTLEHIVKVKEITAILIAKIKEQTDNHDKSKLEEPEKSMFDLYTPFLEITEYNSEEYNKLRSEIKETLDHHYSVNRHHPEHFDKENPSLGNMNLVDIIEMICDWIASCERTAEGDIFKSIQIKKKQYKFDDQMEQILINTVKLIKGEK